MVCYNVYHAKQPGNPLVDSKGVQLEKWILKLNMQDGLFESPLQ
jgi:hypothetical protein